MSVLRLRDPRLLRWTAVPVLGLLAVGEAGPDPTSRPSPGVLLVVTA